MEKLRKKKRSYFTPPKPLKVEFLESIKFLILTLPLYPYAPVKLFCPHLPREHHFFGSCPGLLITIFLPCSVLIKHFLSFSSALLFFTSFSSAPPFFIRHIFPLTLGLLGVGERCRTIRSAH